MPAPEPDTRSAVGASARAARPQYNRWASFTPGAPMLDSGKPGPIRLLALIAVALTGMAAFAQTKPPDYPNRTIRIIAPVQTGGGVDLVARTVADRLRRGRGGPLLP